MHGITKEIHRAVRASALEERSQPSDEDAKSEHAYRGLIILISDLLDPQADKVIRELAATGSELVVLHVLSPDELDPPLEGDLRLVDSETGEGVDVTLDVATLDAYRTRLTEWQASLADLCARRRATYVAVSTDIPLADLVFAELRRRRVLG